MVVSPTIAAPFSVMTSDHQGRGTIAALMIGNDIGSSLLFDIGLASQQRTKLTQWALLVVFQLKPTHYPRTRILPFREACCAICAQVPYSPRWRLDCRRG